jgi:hypothetical protein
MPDGCLEIPQSSRYRLDKDFLMDALHSGHFDWLGLALNGADRQRGQLPPAVARIAEAWPSMPPHIREAIATLVDAGMTSSDCRQSASGSAEAGSIDALSWRIARQCRAVVQTCLREEEWADADREFCAVISAGLGRPHC